MKITFLPKAKWGKWSLIMMVISWIFFVMGSVLPWKSGYSGFEIISQNPLQSIITVLILVAGCITFIAGFMSVVKNKERSVLVLLAILSGLYSMLGFLGSIVTIFFS